MYWKLFVFFLFFLIISFLDYLLFFSTKIAQEPRAATSARPATVTVPPHPFFSSVLFGIIFSVGWTPCVGAFLGSALMLASQQGHVLEGMGMLLAYSVGLGIPFLISAVLIDKLKTAFNWIKSHYNVINMVSGAVLVFVGILMATGALGKLLAVLS